MVGDQTSEVTVRLIDPDHFSYHGPSEMIDDACRTVLRVCSATAESYSEGSRSTENEGGKTIASRSWKMTKDIEGAVYRVTTLLLDGQDPVVMLEIPPWRQSHTLLKYPKIGRRPGIRLRRDRCAP